MKTFKSVTEKFEEDMKELGVSAFVIAARDPDSDSMYWHRGEDILWQLGAARMLSDRLRETCTLVGEDDDEEDWKQD